MKKKEELETLLLVVDMNKGFNVKGNMADPYIQKIIPSIKELIETIISKKEGLAIIKEWHREDSIEFLKFLKHCVANTEEAELVDELKEYEKYGLVYLKNSTSAIFAKGFLEDIKKMKKLKRIIITGCCTDICILNAAIPLQNFFDESNINIEIIVPENATETYNAPNHEREEYNEMARKLMRQSGIKTPDYIRKEEI